MFKLYNLNTLKNNTNKNTNTNLKKIDFNVFLKKYNINNICISDSLRNFKRIKYIYKLNDYDGKTKNTNVLFFGLYNNNDFLNIKNNLKNNGRCFIIFGGSDLENLNLKILTELYNSKNIQFISISKYIHTKLYSNNITSHYVDFNLVDKNIFKPIDKITGDSIYVYDGYNEHSKKSTYNHTLISDIISKLPQYNFIRSSEINSSYEEMPNIYKKCFIGLRLTNFDGNANTAQEFEAMGIPIVHNHSDYGLKWKNIDDIITHIFNYSHKDVMTMQNFKCINIENNYSYKHLIYNSNGDCINEFNFIRFIKENGITLYYNNIFISGDINLNPEITIVRNKTYENVINKKNVFFMCIPYSHNSNGIYCITKSFVEALKNKQSLLYPHVYDYSQFESIVRKPIFLHEQSVDKKWYNWLSDTDINNLKLKYFNKNTFVICICGRIAINSYPKSLLDAVKNLRNNGYDIQILALTKFEVNPNRLTKELYNEITGYEWVKQFTVNKKDILNYFRICDVLASTYRDYCNHVGGSNKIKEYLLCEKPILCSRGKERERELGKDYYGFYECKTCNTVPPLCWTKEFLNNKNVYVNQYNKYFKNVDLTNEIKEISDFILHLCRPNPNIF